MTQRIEARNRPDPGQGTTLVSGSTARSDEVPVRARAWAPLLERHMSLGAERLRVLAVKQAPDGRTVVQQRMDVALASATLGISAGGRHIDVPIGFRMIGGFGPAPVKAKARLSRELPKPLLREIGSARFDAVCTGKAHPETLRKVVQALVDRDPAAFADARAVRKLMLDYCIGCDCSGWVVQELAAAHALPAPRESMHASDDSTRDTARVKGGLLDARPGDSVVLAPGNDGVGHKVIVYAHRVLDADTRSFERERGNSDPEFLKAGPIHVFEVDSSWGNGGDAARGGVQRRTWLFAEASGRWGSFGGGTFVETAGPYGHRLTGVFRPVPRAR